MIKWNKGKSVKRAITPANREDEPDFKICPVIQADTPLAWLEIVDQCKLRENEFVFEVNGQHCCTYSSKYKAKTAAEKWYADTLVAALKYYAAADLERQVEI
jgi:hypothetical protein